MCFSLQRDDRKQSTSGKVAYVKSYYSALGQNVAQLLLIIYTLMLGNIIPLN